MIFDTPQFDHALDEFVSGAIRGENDGNIQSWLLGLIIDGALESLWPQLVSLIDSVMEVTEQGRWADDGGLTI